MPITEIALAYANAFVNNTEIEGGIAYRSLFNGKKFDYSISSLQEIDLCLAEVFGLIGEDNFDIGLQENVNLAYAVAFYSGCVIDKATGLSSVWYQYDEIIADDEQLSQMIPNCFGTSILCVTNGKLFIPLSSVMTILVEGPGEKSVWYSTKGQVDMLQKKG